MNISELINRLGGATRVADMVGVRVSSISRWRVANKIPRKKLIILTSIAEGFGVFTRQELFLLGSSRNWPELVTPIPRLRPIPPIPDDCKAIYPLLKNCGRFKDERAIACFLGLPPMVRAKVFNTTPPHQLISDAMCLNAGKLGIEGAP